MKPVALLAFALALFACATTPKSEFPVQTDGLATFGQPTRVGPLVATPLSLVEDSRCPVNARCVWAGRLILKTRIDGAGWRETVDLTLGAPHSLRGASLVLVWAEPGRMAGAEPAPPATLFGFEPR